MAMAIVVIASCIGCVIDSTGAATKIVTGTSPIVRRATRICIASPRSALASIVWGWPLGAGSRRVLFG